MRAIVVSPNEWAEVGTVIEIVGFVYYDAMIWAIWRDDPGMLQEVPYWAVRMQPATPPALPPANAALIGHLG